MLSPLNETEIIMAQTAHAGQRLDRFLADHLPGLSRSRLKAMVQEGDVSAQNAVLTDPNAKVRAGVAYHVALRPAVSAVPLGQDIPFTILFEDAHLIVLDKPAGLVVHPAPGNLDGTLVNALIAHCGDSLTGIGGEKRPGIVHRLDKETSGVMVAAKTQFAHAALSALFAARDLDRSYLALCWGLPSPLAGSIQGPIGRDPRDRKRMAIVSRGGKPALTHYKTLRPFGTGAALVSCQLATGRTHQIRVHLAHTGHPLIGDPVYLRRRPAAAGFLPLPARDLALDFPRQALHAASLGFVHPVTGKPVQFETKPPADFAALLAALDESSIEDC